ncbi:MAG: biotin transporter BioY [Chlamydiae bacterium]|nr:biotin transporter BioY [Chlamydiota bacterium]
MFLNAIVKEKTSFIEEALIIILASLCISLAAPLAIKLPFTNIPLAIAPHLALAFGILLGKNRASITAICYLLQGALGLPVFALGASGIFYLFGPTGGYLLGYVAGAYVAGYVMQKSPVKTAFYIALALLAGNLTIYLFGAIYLSIFVGIKTSIALGVLPFVIGDALKIGLIAKVLCRSRS